VFQVFIMWQSVTITTDGTGVVPCCFIVWVLVYTPRDHIELALEAGAQIVTLSDSSEASVPCTIVEGVISKQGVNEGELALPGARQATGPDTM
jgi:hypothetical protein